MSSYYLFLRPTTKEKNIWKYPTIKRRSFGILRRLASGGDCLNRLAQDGFLEACLKRL
jgi:hypothetical protein